MTDYNPKLAFNDLTGLVVLWFVVGINKSILLKSTGMIGSGHYKEVS